MQIIIGIMQLFFAIGFISTTLAVLFLHFYVSISLVLLVYDVLLISYFIIPKFINRDCKSRIANMNKVYLYTGGLMLIAFAYYLIEILHK